MVVETPTCLTSAFNRLAVVFFFLQYVPLPSRRCVRTQGEQQAHGVAVVNARARGGSDLGGRAWQFVGWLPLLAAFSFVDLPFAERQKTLTQGGRPRPRSRC